MTRRRSTKRLTWTHDDQTAEDVQLLARLMFRAAVAEHVPEVLTTLGDVAVQDTEPDAAGLAAWARQYALTAAWCLDLARVTRRMWALCPELHGRVWGTMGAGGTPRGARHPGLLKDAQHVVWLARYQCGQVPYLRLARAAGRQVQSVRDACADLAEVLGLTLRPGRRGRPRLR